MNIFEDKVKRGFLLQTKAGVSFLTIPSFLEAGFEKHCYTTRKGGVSKGCYASLNLSKTRENSPQNKEENYRRVCRALDVPYESLTLVNYAHGDGICKASAEDAGKGIVRENDLPPCDAMIICETGITAVTLHADCVPVFFADKKQRIACVSHAGWRGVYSGLPAKVANVFFHDYHTSADDLLIGIGPHIMTDCFEVQEDVAQPFSERFGGAAVVRKERKLYVDLQYAILKQFDQAGVSLENITCADLCTYMREDLFFSHRRDQGNTGAMGSFINLETKAV
ncbi:polyphenol oxidase family protein [Christensenella tenuis]|uniref:Laccase domain-containing protein n=1 Tax=Christensenella tenuis TaxID=2763033 RepID=A0ABR7EDB7_9FIRM|nr:polyphenol oxidase family protein [Christensenella tenuis]MBC5647316.1 laccase domain-containing protein [Christensenella tenuis]